MSVRAFSRTTDRGIWLPEPCWATKISPPTRNKKSQNKAEMKLMGVDCFGKEQMCEKVSPRPPLPMLFYF